MNGNDNAGRRVQIHPDAGLGEGNAGVQENGATDAGSPPRGAGTPKSSSMDPLALLAARRPSPDFGAQMDELGILYEDEPPSIGGAGNDAVYIRDSARVSYQGWAKTVTE